jgi:hypothetical protein
MPLKSPLAGADDNTPFSENKTMTRQGGVTHSEGARTATRFPPAITTHGKSLGLLYTEDDEASAQLLSLKKKVDVPSESMAVSAFKEIQNLNPKEQIYKPAGDPNDDDPLELDADTQEVIPLDRSIMLIMGSHVPTELIDDKEPFSFQKAQDISFFDEMLETSLLSHARLLLKDKKKLYALTLRKLMIKDRKALELTEKQVNKLKEKLQEYAKSEKGATKGQDEEPVNPKYESLNNKLEKIEKYRIAWAR